jgi:hypothetical protein
MLNFMLVIKYREKTSFGSNNLVLEYSIFQLKKKNTVGTGYGIQDTIYN